MIKPFEPFKVDQYFGNPTSYGPHEGWDMNGLGGGNTDLGTPLKAVGDGEVIHSSESTKDYGKLVVLRVFTTGGERWVRYCHCQEILVKSGLVKSSDILAKMGSTGNSTASHLHFDVFKKVPPQWRWFAKTKTELNEYFEDPEAFFKLNPKKEESPCIITDQTRISQIENKEVQAIKSEYYDRANIIESQKNEISKLKNDVKVKDAKIAELQKELNKPKPPLVVVEGPATGTDSSNTQENISYVGELPWWLAYLVRVFTKANAREGS